MVSRLISPRLALVVAAALLLIAAQERTGPAFAAEFTVTWGSTDAVDANPGDGVCDDGTGNCTLRAAIMETNALPGADTIGQAGINAVLSIPGAGEDDAACPATDQRLVARPQDGDGDGESHCDVGAYELRAPYPTPTPMPAQLPPTGGEPGGEGNSWLYAVLAGALALAGAGGALVAARRRP